MSIRGKATNKLDKLSLMSTTSSKAHLLAVLITLAGLALVGYAPVVGSWFLADDFLIISNVSLPGGATDWGRVLSDFYGSWMGQKHGYFYRPIGTLLFGLDYSLYGANAFGYHLTNLSCTS
jgi:protein O-mannosyl-transferase